MYKMLDPGRLAHMQPKKAPSDMGIKRIADVSFDGEVRKPRNRTGRGCSQPL